MRKPRIAICDLLFCWPPDAGAFVDVWNVATRLAKEADVMLIVPHIESLFRAHRTALDLILARHSRFFLRGATDGELPFPVKQIPFTGMEFGPAAIGIEYLKAVSEFGPDKTFVTNGWHLKPYLVKALGAFNPILRLYAHEFLCTKADGWFFRRAKSCERDYLTGGSKDYLACLFCSTAFYMGFPAARWVQEYVKAGAYKPSYASVVKEAFAIASDVIVYNERTAARVRPYNSSVRIVPSGIDTKAFRPGARDLREKIVTIVPGRVQEKHKGRYFLLEVIRAMEKLRPNMVFHITGTSPFFHGPNVHEVGWGNPRDLPGLYQQADIAFIPSLWPEPYGIVAVEAAASGIPVVASAVGGLKELIQDGETGFLVPPGNVEKAAQALCLLCDDRELRLRLGDRGRVNCVNNFDWDSIFDRHYRPFFLVGS